MQAWKKFTAIDGGVYRMKKNIFRLYVPDELRCELVAEVHKPITFRNWQDFGKTKMRNFITVQ